MMTSFLSKHSNLTSHEGNLCDFKTYVMFRNGLYKTCGRGKALELLREGWHDLTQYKPKQEVLSNGICTKLQVEGRQSDARSTWQTSPNNYSSEGQHETVRCGSDTSSEREEPRHQQHQPNTCDQGRTGRSGAPVRPGQTHSEVIRKRGRPKRGA
jgi:hypothetical protein